MSNEVAYRPIQRMRGGGKAPCILNLSTRRRRVVDCTLQSLYRYGIPSVPTGYIRRSLDNTNCIPCIAVTGQKHIISFYPMFTSKPTLFPVSNAVSVYS
jgi:hypothetical protein